MERVIVGFDQDEMGDWRAILACGHQQHVRHNPPLVSRPWVLTEEGRSRYLGVALDCKACDEGEPVNDAVVSPEVLEAIYRQFRADLERFIQAHVTSSDAAEAILHDVYRQIHAQASGLPDDARLARWLYRLTRNAILDHNDRVPTLSEQPDWPSLLADDDGEGADALAAAAREMLACLPGPYRQALSLAEHRNMTLPEIAERLDVSLAEAQGRIQGGREMWREALLDFCHFEAERSGRELAYQPRCPFCAAGG